MQLKKESETMKTIIFQSVIFIVLIFNNYLFGNSYVAGNDRLPVWSKDGNGKKNYVYVYHGVLNGFGHVTECDKENKTNKVVCRRFIMNIGAGAFLVDLLRVKAPTHTFDEKTSKKMWKFYKLSRFLNASGLLISYECSKKSN